MVGRFHGMLYCYLRNTQDLLSDGNHITKGDSANHQRTNNSVWFDGRISPICAKDLSRLHQFGKKVVPGIFIGHVLYAGGIWKGDILVADVEELEKMDATEIHARDGTVKLSGGYQVAREMGSPRHACNRRRTREWHILMCANSFLQGVAHAGEKGELTSCHGTVQLAWQKPPVSRKEEELGCPHLSLPKPAVNRRQ